LTEAEQAAFRRFSKFLGQRGAETPQDAAALELLAVLYARWLAAKQELERTGLLVEDVVLDNHGQAVTKRRASPLVRILQDSEAKLMHLLRDMGLTPMARDKVKPAAAPEAKREPSQVEKMYPDIFGLKEGTP